jgi:DNA-binding transcriptional LysR family regulator
MLALEAVTGSELFHRRARGYELTEQGTVLLNQIAGLEAQILPLDRSLDTEGGLLVKVSAGSWMTHILCQNIRTILKGNETTRLRFISAEHVLDIVHRETVIGIRNQRPEQGGLACRRIGRVQFAGYAVSKAIKSWVRVMGQTPSALWLAGQPPDAMNMEVTAPRNALDLACAGIARALLPTFIGDAQRDLIRVTAPITELTHDQWLVTHQDERFRPEVRLTIDRIYELARSLHR